VQIFKTLMVLCLSLQLSIAAQTKELSAFEQWRLKKQQAFTQFKDERDQAFIEQMQTRWTQYKTNPGIRRDTKPKPSEIPIAPDDSDKELDGIVVQLDKPEPAVVTPIVIPPEKPLITRPEPVGSAVSFDFFGDDMTLVVPKNFQVKLRNTINDKSITQAWAQLAVSDYEGVLDQLHEEMTDYQLKDWAKIQLIFQFVNAMPRSNSNERIVMSWFLLSRFGLDIRVAHSKSTVFLLLPIEQEVYEVAFLTEQGQKYYIFNMNGGVKKVDRLSSYRGEFDQKARLVNVEFEALNWKQPRLKSRTLAFEWNNDQYKLTTDYAAQDVLYYRTYPLLGLESYFDATYRFDYNNTILIQLHQLVNGRSEIEALNIILRFVQTSFQYETDEKQFGQENYLLPTEMLHYRASDCEDRSILFAWLVKQLFGYEVIGIKYPGHVTTGVAIKGTLVGDIVEFQSRKYLIADPTYINANMGMAMKSYRDQRPERI